MPTISGLGHVGLYCFNLDAQEQFYTGVLGLTKTDEDRQHGLVFLSAQPEEEHHELLLVAGRRSEPHTQVVQQISFRCASLDSSVSQAHISCHWNPEEAPRDAAKSDGFGDPAPQF